MNIRGFISRQLSSDTAKKLLSLKYREDHYYKLMFGKLKGSRLLYRKDVNYHVMLGLWEMDSIALLVRIFKKFNLKDKKLVVADVGANIGYYSIFFSKYFDPSSEIFAFEPSQKIYTVLKRNIEINNITNVRVLDFACSDHSGKDQFFIAEDHHASSLLKEWSSNATKGTKTEVETITLDDCFEKFNEGNFPDLIKMDIEGGGIFALKGCTKCITQKRPLFLFESHNRGEDQAVGRLLREFNYEAFRISNEKWILHKDKDYTDPDGVWGTMLLMPEERKPDFIN